MQIENEGDYEIPDSEELPFSKKFYNVAKLKSVIEIPKSFEDELFNMDILTIQQQMKSIVVLGSTGAGKSATCKTLTGQRDNEVFKTSDRMSSATYLTKGMLSNWYGREGLERIFVIDTPGLGDSQGRDTKHLAQMILALQTLQYVNVFMLTFNIQKHRMDDNT